MCPAQLYTYLVRTIMLRYFSSINNEARMTGTEIAEQTVHLDRHGRKMPVYIAQPKGSTEAAPSIIVIHEIFGLNDHIKDVARRFAAQGLVAYAPDLFEGAEGLPADRNELDGMRAAWQRIPDSQFISDLQEIFNLASKSEQVDAGKIGVIGYCMGGAMALMFAGSTPGVAWVVDYYGRIRYGDLSDTKSQHPIDYVRSMRCPFLGLFAGEDQLIPASDVAELTERLKSTGQHFEVEVYKDARHAFFNDTREFYNEKAAKDAWKKTLQFISNVARSAVRS
jgi:carboxymethylenebutenolidase